MNERCRSLRGRLYFHRNGRNSHPCRIVDASYEGARIIVDNPNGIPDEIVLYIPKRKRLARASVRWRHGERIGLTLSEIGLQADQCPSRSRATLAGKRASWLNSYLQLRQFGDVERDSARACP